MRKIFFIILFVNASVGYSQSKELQNDSLNHKWEISLGINTPEPLAIAGFDYNALTQRIFINGVRKEYSIDAGLGCARKLRGSVWVNLNFNYAYYYAYETRDSRIYDGTSGGYELDTLEISQSSFEISSGMFHRTSVNKVQFDVGGQLRVKVFSEIDGMTLYSGYSPSSTYESTMIYDQNEPGGFSFGISPSIHVHYKLGRNFSLGVKGASFISFYKTGGPITTTQTRISAFGTETGTEITSTQSFEGIRFFPFCLTLRVTYSFY